MTTLTEALGADDDLLVAFPLHRTEIRIGYARVSTGGQNLDRQLDALNATPGCRRIFADKKSGKNAQRPELKACHAFLQEGDTLVVPSLDRYGRSLQDLVNMVAELHVFAALAEFIRELIVQGTNEGLAAARARGRVGGRPTVVSPDILRAARDMLPNPENSVETIAKLLGVSVGTLYNHIPDLKELRVSRVPAQLEGSA
ncbi:resolvase [Streptomyces libani subsp. rufus]|nr:resolvase [Streptomyces libani subsp. rufus]